ncbi:hypothetical protein E2C01_088412 [Portunus trituberculatus]|uniref:Uncharacterized protein n=1 Tax=Portunus trituberculatus TaxID=210409 RepID=A0A5B7JJS8_PORTR|nr:hypothetical protein [Portunus trituberculatus]
MSHLAMHDTTLATFPHEAPHDTHPLITRPHTLNVYHSDFMLLEITNGTSLKEECDEFRWAASMSASELDVQALAALLYPPGEEEEEERSPTKSTES